MIVAARYRHMNLQLPSIGCFISDLGQPRRLRLPEEVLRLAVIATLSKGYDLDYVWKQVDPSLAKNAADYYIQASESDGEPPGRWWGQGDEALGLDSGEVVDREPYELLFGERKAPDGTPLGRPPGGGGRVLKPHTFETPGRSGARRPAGSVPTACCSRSS